MFQMKHQVSACALAVASAVTWGSFTAHADRKDDRKDPDDRQEHRARKVFVVAMENHNWTQPAHGDIAAADLHESQAPFINSLVNGTSGISDQVAYARQLPQRGRRRSSVRAQLHLG